MNSLAQQQWQSVVYDPPLTFTIPPHTLTFSLSLSRSYSGPLCMSLGLPVWDYFILSPSPSTPPSSLSPSLVSLLTSCHPPHPTSLTPLKLSVFFSFSTLHQHHLNAISPVLITTWLLLSPIVPTSYSPTSLGTFNR